MPQINWEEKYFDEIMDAINKLRDDVNEIKISQIKQHEYLKDTIQANERINNTNCESRHKDIIKFNLFAWIIGGVGSLVVGSYAFTWIVYNIVK